MTASAWLLDACAPDGDARQCAALARELMAQGDDRAAATAFDRAYGLAPDDAEITVARQQLLDRLSVRELGIDFRYVPAGSFLMGSTVGDPDEMPVHPVRLGAFWIAETPISWAAYCELMGWEPPPSGMPHGALDREYGTLPSEERDRWMDLWFGHRLRLQYCEDETIRAVDWHAHNPDQTWLQGNKQTTARELFGEVPRAHPELPWGYTRKPMIAVNCEHAEMLCAHLSTSQTRYRLPTEAEWEKAARGGLIGALYPWGNQPPTPERCDSDRFDEFSIRQMTACPPNGYGLYAMSGCVWEWTADRYDAGYYAACPRIDPPGPGEGEERVLRGGSWADCADAVRVSFRMSFAASSRAGYSPNIGFRLCRTAP